jgi:hypothetical protein
MMEGYNKWLTTTKQLVEDGYSLFGHRCFMHGPIAYHEIQTFFDFAKGFTDSIKEVSETIDTYPEPPNNVVKLFDEWLDKMLKHAEESEAFWNQHGTYKILPSFCFLCQVFVPLMKEAIEKEEK